MSSTEIPPLPTGVSLTPGERLTITKNNIHNSHERERRLEDEIAGVKTNVNRHASLIARHTILLNEYKRIINKQKEQYNDLVLQHNALSIHVNNIATIQVTAAAPPPVPKEEKYRALVPNPIQQNKENSSYISWLEKKN
jgi:hypothetical protein